MDRQRARMDAGKQVAGHGLFQHQRKDHSKCGNDSKRGKPDRHEPGRQRQRTGAPERAREVPDDERKTGPQQKCCNGEKRQFKANAPIEPQEASDERNQAGNQQHQRRQRQTFAMERLFDEYRNELAQCATHRQAEPADRNQVHHDQRGRRPQRIRRKAESRNHHGFRRQQREQRGCEIRHRPAGKRRANHLHPPLVRSPEPHVSVPRAAAGPCCHQ